MKQIGPKGTPRRQVLAGMGMAALGSLLPLGTARAAMPGVTVELFTSQGCSSCPPAERLLAELADRPEVVALSYHVQYWDHIGWTDPFGDPRCQERQERYRDWLKTRFLYTPQMVIGGRFDVVGSRRQEVAQRIMEADRLPRLDLVIEEAAGGATLRLPQGKAGPEGAALLAVRYLNGATTRVRRGENAGRTLTERNIVRDIKKLTLWQGESQHVRLPADVDAEHGQAILLQDMATGAMLAATKRPPAAV